MFGLACALQTVSQVDHRRYTESIWQCWVRTSPSQPGWVEVGDDGDECDDGGDEAVGEWKRVQG